MRLVLDLQKRRSPRHLQIADLAARLNGGVSAMPSGRLVGSNHGTRRFVSVAGITQQNAVPAVS